MKKKPQTSTVNLDADMAREIDALVEKYRPFVRRHAVHVAALRLGLDMLTEDSSKLVDILRERSAT